MTTVVDASVAMRWCFMLDRSDRAANLVHSGQRLIAPELLIPEFINAAWRLVVYAGAPPDLAIDSVSEIGRAFEELVPSVALKDRALAIALELRHPAYDCFYLALAEMREVPLVTADDRLLRRCTNSPFGKLVRPL
jgi:predicted nucleic acid-binding protein